MGRIIYILKIQALQRFGLAPAVLRKSDGWHAKTACDGPENGPKFPWRAIPGSPYKQPKKEHHLGTVFWLTPSLRQHGIGGGRGWRKPLGLRRVTQLLPYLQIDQVDYSWLARFVSLLVLPFAD